MWGPILIEDLWEPKTLGDLQLLSHTVVTVKTIVSDETATCKLVDYQNPLPFIFFRLWN